jgi:hypothetical protein
MAQPTIDGGEAYLRMIYGSTGWVIVQGKNGRPALFLPPEGAKFPELMTFFAARFREEYSKHVEDYDLNGVKGHCLPLRAMGEDLKRDALKRKKEKEG